MLLENRENRYCSRFEQRHCQIFVYVFSLGFSSPTTASVLVMRPVEENSAVCLTCQRTLDTVVLMGVTSSMQKLRVRVLV